MTTEIHATQTKLVESTLGTRERDFYIDCLRSVMIATLACATSWILADPLVRAPGLRRFV